MATVRFSLDLTDKIIENAREMFTEDIRKARMNIPIGWGQKLYDSLFSADVQAKMNALPDGYMNTITEFELTGFKNAPDDVWQSANTKVKTWTEVNVVLHLTSPLRFPDRDKWFNGKIDRGYYVSYGSKTLDFGREEFKWLHEPFKKYTRGIFEAQKKQDDFVAGVQQIINAYTTLAPALKAWQPLWDLLPDETKERHKKIVDRPKVKTAQDIGVDLNKMTSAVAFNKLTRKR